MQPKTNNNENIKSKFITNFDVYLPVTNLVLYLVWYGGSGLAICFVAAAFGQQLIAVHVGAGDGGGVGSWPDIVRMRFYDGHIIK